MKEDKLVMRKYEWDEEFYRQIVIDHNYRFPKFNHINYPNLQEQNDKKGV